MQSLILKRMIINMLFAIETSCDDTSVSLLDMKTGHVIDVLSISQMEHSSYGGVVPELASRKHFSNIFPLIDEILERNNKTYNDITNMAVTYAPGLMGSLLVGVSVAKSMAYTLNIPVIPVHHIEGHIFSNFIENDNIKFPFIALVISGGHTQIMMVKDYHSYELLGDTLDDSAGEAYDKVAKMLGMGYPGGPVIDKLASKGKNDIGFPRPMLKKDNLNFSFSGLKTAVKNYIEKNENYIKEDVAYSFQNAVCDVLLKKIKKAVRETGVDRIVLAGGVAANSQLRRVFSEQSFECIIPERKYCTDNAAMIARAGYFRFRNNFNVLFDKNFYSLNPIAHVTLDEENLF